MKCQRYSRCNRCLKLMYKLRVARYQELRRLYIDTNPHKDDMGNVLMGLRAIDRLLRARVEVGRAYRRWKRGQLPPPEPFTFGPMRLIAPIVIDRARFEAEEREHHNALRRHVADGCWLPGCHACHMAANLPKPRSL